VIDNAPDVIDAGDGNDYVFAGRGDDFITGGLGDDDLTGDGGNGLPAGLMHIACDLFTLRRVNGLLRCPLLCLRTQRMTTETNIHQVKFTHPCWRTRRASVPARLRARGRGACGTRTSSHQHRGLRSISVASANWLRRSGTATRHVCGLGLSDSDKCQDRQGHSMRLSGTKHLERRMGGTFQPLDDLPTTAANESRRMAAA
jgi:Ca2+-binding RTX toxin-like protein